MTMNRRLLAYLRSLGLAATATDDQAWEFYRSLRGAPSTIANALNYAEGDEAARTTCDLMIRAAGFNPENPNEILAPTAAETAARQQTAASATAQQTAATATAATTAGGDGASLGGDLERARVEGEQRALARIDDINSVGQMAGCTDDFIRTLTHDPAVTVEVARQRIRADWEARTRATTVQPDVPNAGPAIHSRNSQTDFNALAMTASLMMRAGIADPTRDMVRRRPGQLLEAVQVTDEINRAADRGYELQQLPARVFIQRALALDGIQVEPTVDSIVRAFATRGAAMSTTSLVNIFTQTFGAQLLRSFTQTVDTTRGWTREGENQNYLPNQLVRVGLGENLAHLPRGGEAEHMGFGDETQYTKLYRYARQAVFDEMDLVNDNFGVITSTTPTIMGEAAARLRPDLVYAILFANPTMEDGVALFHATHGNTATSSAFSETLAETTFAAMAAQRVGTINVNFTPRWVVHPVTLDFAVDKVLNPNAILVTGENATRVNYSAIGRKGLSHVGEPRLDNGVVDPKTGTTYAGDLNDWFMTGEGTESPIQVDYLAGTNRSPRFRSGTLDRGQFGIWFDVQHAIGAKAINYRTIFRRQG